MFREALVVLVMAGCADALADTCWNSFVNFVEGRSLPCMVRIDTSVVAIGGERQNVGAPCCFNNGTSDMESVYVSDNEDVGWVGFNPLPFTVRGTGTCAADDVSVYVSPAANDVTTTPDEQGSDLVGRISFDDDQIQPLGFTYLPSLPAPLMRAALFTDTSSGVYIAGGMFAANRTPTESIFHLPSGAQSWTTLGSRFDIPACDCVAVTHLKFVTLLCTDCVQMDQRMTSHMFQYEITSQKLTQVLRKVHASSVVSISAAPIQQFAAFVVMLAWYSQPYIYFWDLALLQWTNITTDYFSQARAFGATFASLHRLYYGGGRIRDNVTGALEPELSTNIDHAPVVPAIQADVDRADRTYTIGGAPIVVQAPKGMMVRLALSPRCLTNAFGTNDTLSATIPGRPISVSGQAVIHPTATGVGYVCVAASTCAIQPSWRSACPTTSFDFGDCALNGCCWDDAIGFCYASAPAADALQSGIELFYQQTNLGPVFVNDAAAGLVLTWWLIVIIVAVGVVLVGAVVVIFHSVRTRTDEATKAAKEVVHQFAGVTSKYEFVRRIGSGGFGTVFLVKKRSNGQPFALKYIPCTSDEDRSLAMKEFELLRQAQGHRGMVKITDMFMNWDEETSSEYGSLQVKEGDTTRPLSDRSNPLLSLSSRFLCIVMTYCPEGDLSHYVYQAWRNGRPLAEEWLLRVICDELCDVLDYIHTLKPPIVHRDLKPENVLLVDGASHILITDFGLACEFEKAYLTTRTGSLQYVAPECWNRHYTPAVDMWAVGCILYAAATGRVSADNARVMFNDAKDKRFHRSIRDDLTAAGYSARFSRIVIGLLQADPAKRLTAKKVRELLHGPPSASASRVEIEVSPEDE